MKILEVLTYYRPHVSGLTIYVERLCRTLAAQGHEVTVLTSQYDPALPRHEVMDGVNIVRVPVAFRISKGVIMPTFGWLATKYARKTDVMHLHLPQFDAPGLALRGRLFRKPVVLTYHCDLQLPTGGFNKIVDKVVAGANRIAGNLANAVVTYTRDYGSHSPFLSPYLDQKLHIIPPPVSLTACTLDDAAALRTKVGLKPGDKVIGISARLATEKGVEILLKALPIILESHPNTHVMHAGPYQNVLGEEEYAARLAPLFAQFEDRYHFLGTLHKAELTAFYKSLDVLVIPSLNSTESFGLVQIEAMMNGVPVVASNLPGVRQPVTMTGMGLIAGIGNIEETADSLITILSDKEKYQRHPQIIANSFSPEQTAADYLDLFNKINHKITNQTSTEPAPYETLREMRDEREEDWGLEIG